ncbi:SIS domain-containing protein [Nonomuraea sp. NN258]|uniref:D-sedoheptulose-7-phosphate isomerase n=1 Tax=Nonomuraea antri TaxID=2730852 RepID=UPI001569E93C|nr:SIS domain-containing protein [Nonomuraea antri]NRQ38950.1 SIS domain-containing protein [Nonomuraea antri]
MQYLLGRTHAARTAARPVLGEGGEELRPAVNAADRARRRAELRQEVLRLFAPPLAGCAVAMAAAFLAGGRLFTFGNGGSGADAVSVARLFSRSGLPALSLADEPPLLPALGHDVGFEVAFSRQLGAFGRAGDLAMALSTGGGSDNVLSGLAEARRCGMTTIGLAGPGGGRMAQDDLVDHLFAVPASTIRRIQAAQSTLCHLLWELVSTDPA